MTKEIGIFEGETGQPVFDFTLESAGEFFKSNSEGLATIEYEGDQTFLILVAGKKVGQFSASDIIRGNPVYFQVENTGPKLNLVPLAAVAVFILLLSKNQHDGKN